MVFVSSEAINFRRALMVRESQSSRVERAIELKKSGLLDEEPSGALKSKLNRNKESDDEVNCE